MNSLQQSLAWLGEETGSQIKLGLAQMHALLGELGRPDLALPFTLHIAGTNGKGSVARMAAAILQRARCRTALYTSPALQRPTEVTQVAGQQPDARQLSKLVERLAPATKRVGQILGARPTPFERWTALMFLWAAREQVDVLVLEAGLGGRLDATNAVARSQVAVITDIHRDHTRWLGENSAAIAGEKAGIIKPGASVVTAVQGGALKAVAAAARRRQAPLYLVHRVPPGEKVAAAPPPGRRQGEAAAGHYFVGEVQESIRGTRFTVAGPGLPPTNFHSPLLGRHQAVNGALAVAAVLQLARHGLKAAVAPAALQAGVSQTYHAGRLELWSSAPTIILDLAHNPQAMATLAATLGRLFPDYEIVLLCGLLADKDAAGVVKAWQNRPPKRIVTVAPVNPRALAAAELARRFREAGLPAEAAASWQHGLRQTLAAVTGSPDGPAPVDRAGGNTLLCICGSNYLVGPARAKLAALKF